MLEQNSSVLLPILAILCAGGLSAVIALAARRLRRARRQANVPYIPEPAKGPR